MNYSDLHSWNVDYKEAVSIQRQLVGELVEQPVNLSEVQTVAGVDLSSSRGSSRVYAAAVVLDLNSLGTVDQSTISMDIDFPYVPGLLSFREGPAVLKALARLEVKPDVVIFDGQGIAHPRRLGLAAHMGLWLGVPTVGCAKTRLVGEYEEPGSERGSMVPLTDKGELIGKVLRTRSDIKPVFVSRGHLCDLSSAISLILTTAIRYRLPEPIRKAHKLCNQVRKGSHF